VSGESDCGNPRAWVVVGTSGLTRSDVASWIPLTVLQRIRAEYEEAPGLHLTVEQAERFLGLDRSVCQGAFDQLEHAGFLCRSVGGAYRRSTRV
jgi:hypothetical protein